MIHSMTGYAAAAGDTPRGALNIELRSVNARFLDLQFRVSDELRSLEPALRELIAARVSRGKLDCRVFLNEAAIPPGARIDAEALARSSAAAVAERVAAMRAALERAAPLVPQALAAYQAKLTERLREAMGSADDERIRAEMAVFATRVDVDEELTRLRAHFDEVERTLKKGGAVGKRLDFLAQELNREANTLASKAASADLSDCALELKLLIEQMREQVQNIE
jgi:uncharacterized protein YicC (UPF0701 family)